MFLTNDTLVRISSLSLEAILRLCVDITVMVNSTNDQLWFKISTLLFLTVPSQVRMYSRALAIIGGFLILASGAGEVYRQKPRSRSLQSTGQVFLGVYLICMVRPVCFMDYFYLLIHVLNGCVNTSYFTNAVQINPHQVYSLQHSKEDRQAYLNHIMGGDITLMLLEVLFGVLALAFLSGCYIRLAAQILAIVLPLVILLIDGNLGYWHNTRKVEFWNQMKLIGHNVGIFGAVLILATDG